MDRDHLQIAIDSNEASWKQRCSEKMRELKNRQFSSADPASQPGLMHKELVLHKNVMISELYKAVENENVDNFVDVLGQVCERRKLPLRDIFDEVMVTGDSLLHVAAYLGREKIAELICDESPGLLTGRNIRGDTALHAAVRLKKSTMVNLILSKYAIEKAKHYGMRDNDITRQKNEHGDTPLHVAVSSGDLGLVEEIAHADKDVVHFLNKSEQSPLYLAVVSGDVEILNLLLQTPFPSEKPLPTCLGNSPLHAAILEQNPRLIKEILEKRPELVYLRDENGCTPLHYATFIGYVEGFCMLLKNSIERSDQTPFVSNKKGNLPIHLACKEGHLEIVKKFLNHQWHISPFVLLNQKGRNILHVAAKNGKSEVVLYLLKNRKINQFTVNEKDNDGNTPLHLASINLFPKIVYYITQDKRTNANLSNNYGLTARDVVHQALKKMTSTRKFLVNLVFKEVGATLKANDMSYSQEKQPRKEGMNFKDLLNTFLVVATLMVTVTFAAGFTVPGGVYSSDDLNPKNRGMAVLAHKPFFWVFTIFNVIAMYSSVVACGLMLMAVVFDRKLATRVTILAILCLVVAFLTVPVSFLAAVRIVVGNDSALALIITIIGAMYIFFILVALSSGFFPVGIVLRIPLLNYVSKFVLWILITKLIDYSEKPEKEVKEKEG
ncbi:hypothetical protein Fmac_021665 [Flemingia macrophylla]|uniref:PGG domain-containing protein n=1 Tax=Flemingia macrophylla TaxID=520843 RepID=A0ABD1LXL2_9FABA